MGNTVPGHPPFRVPTQVAAPLVFHAYVCFSLHNHYFIGSFEKRVHKNVRK